MAKTENLNDFIRLILKFASEENSRKRHLQLYRIKNQAYFFGYMVLDKVGRRDTGISIHYQTALVKFLNQFHESGTGGFNLSAEIVIVGTNKEGYVALTHIHDEHYNGLWKMFVMLFSNHGYKGIDRCSICDGFYLYRRQRKLKLCSGKCKAQLYRNKKSAAAKEAARKKREAFFNGNNNGGAK